MFWVIDDKEQERYNDMGLAVDLVFSPNGDRSTYIGETGKFGSEKYFAVIDGKEQQQYEDFLGGGLTFSPDSKQIAYVIHHISNISNKGSQDTLILDGKDIGKYDVIDALTFSPDSKKIAYVATENATDSVVVGGTKGRNYDQILTSYSQSKIQFDSPDSLHYLARDGGKIYLVEEKIKLRAATPP